MLNYFKFSLKKMLKSFVFFLKRFYVIFFFWWRKNDSFNTENISCVQVTILNIKHVRVEKKSGEFKINFKMIFSKIKKL